MGLLREIWTYVVTERFGYRRPMDTPVDDHAARAEALAKVDQLEQAIETVYREHARIFRQRARERNAQ
jgi:hypothetical protein